MRAGLGLARCVLAAFSLSSFSLSTFSLSTFSLSRHVTALGVIRYVPTGAFELKSGCGHQPMHVSSAFFVDRERLIRKFLDYFKGFAAAFALVFVYGQR